MNPSQSRTVQMVLACALFLASSLTIAQQGAMVSPRVTAAIDPEKVVVLRGNTHPLARPEFDRGAAPDSQPMRRMLLVLKRSPEQEAELRRVLDEQQTKSSPNFHKWLTPQEFGGRFGPADADVQAVTGWLTSEGFQVGRVAAGRTVIEFSGTAGQVRRAFHTEIHRFVVKGQEQAEAWANTNDPQIPAALAPVVKGLASLNNFPRRSMLRRLGAVQRSKVTGELKPLFNLNTVGVPNYAVGPTDFATIYNLLPLWNAGVDGTGVAIAIVAQTDINPQDVADFRNMFGLSVNPPNIIYNGPNPGLGPDEGEGDLDAQWSGAVATGATIDFVVSESTETSAGVDLSALYIVDNNLAPVMSESYGACELFLGDGGNAFYYYLWEQAAAQGITVMVAAGDAGSAGCDNFNTQLASVYGPMVSGFASTPFNVAVGGTDFDDVGMWSAYWNPTNASTTASSAKSYIPETTWNDSCARFGDLAGCSFSSPDLNIVAGGGGATTASSRTASTRLLAPAAILNRPGNRGPVCRTIAFATFRTCPYLPVAGPSVAASTCFVRATPPPPGPAI